MTKIYISEELRSVLTHNDINPDTGYTPAYGGESAGLDLFNCSDDVIVKPQTGEYNSERTLIRNKILTIEYLYKMLKERTRLKSWNCFHHENVQRNIELTKSYIYLFKLIYQLKKLAFCKVLSSNFVNNSELYNPDVIYSIFKD